MRRVVRVKVLYNLRRSEGVYALFEELRIACSYCLICSIPNFEFSIYLHSFRLRQMFESLWPSFCPFVFSGFMHRTKNCCFPKSCQIVSIRSCAHLLNVAFSYSKWNLGFNFCVLSLSFLRIFSQYILWFIDISKINVPIRGSVLFSSKRGSSVIRQSLCEVKDGWWGKYTTAR